MKVEVAILGGTGYAGAELVRLLKGHPRVTVGMVTSGRKAGIALEEECPWLETDLVLREPEPDSLECEIAFLCLDHGQAANAAETLVARGVKVIDLSADLRLKNADVHTKTYGEEPSPLADEALYGLPEWTSRDAYHHVRVIANPGCHPTAALLAMMPLARETYILGTPVIDSLTGVSGAGRSGKNPAFTFSELAGATSPYKVTEHRHIPEIEQTLGRTVRFTPHLIPMARGMVATCHVPVRSTSEKELHELYHDVYAQAPCVRVVRRPPSSKQVLGTNRCDIFVTYDPRTEMAVVVATIDNLGKGASGQAVQNLNLMMGWEETMGLPLDGVWP